MGNGKFGKKLGYKEWFEFNTSMRAHQNFVEQLFIYTVFQLVSGLLYPTLSIIAGLVYFSARLGFAINYKKGANERRPYAILLNPTLVVLMGTSIYVGL